MSSPPPPSAGLQVSLTFDAGTLVVEGLPPKPIETAPEFDEPTVESPNDPGLTQGLVWDPRVHAWRAAAWRYRDLVARYTRASRAGALAFDDRARAYASLALVHRAVRGPFAHQREAVDAWRAAGQRGIVVLPTGAGKSYVAEMALLLTQRAALVVVPTLDLVNQWYDVLTTAFGEPVGLLGGGHHDVRDLTVSTYDSAAIHVDRLGARFGLVVFDECHHLPSPTYLQIAECAIAPFRLGLTATLDRDDGRQSRLNDRVGPVVYERGITELAGEYLADYDTVRLSVPLDDDEAERYRDRREVYRFFLLSQGIRMSDPDGWQQFITRASRSEDGRRAFLAYREQRQIAIASRNKMSVLEGLLRQHAKDRVIVFTNDNESVYQISRRFLLPALTHQTDMKERRAVLAQFGSGEYPAIVTSRVLNEGVNIPDANVAIVLSGTGSVREHVQRLGRVLRRREGKRATLYEVITAGTVEERISDRRREHDAYRDR